MTESAKETWGGGDAYDRYIGRWSRRVAQEFLAWLKVEPGLGWGDVGCGTGSLVEGILRDHLPASITAVDRAEGFIRTARERITDARVQFEVGDAQALTWPDQSRDVTVSGLVLNFVLDQLAMASEMARVTRPGGTVGVYVWDYMGGMQLIKRFWEAAVEFDPSSATLDQAERFPICQPGPLEALFQKIGLDSVEVRAIQVPTMFRDFDDYWSPFLGKQGPAPTYLAGLDAPAQERIREKLRATLPAAADGTIALTAKAWAVKGTKV